MGEYAPEFGLEDYDYWMRMNRLFKIAHLDSDEALYRYRVHDNSISAQAEELKIRQRVERLMRHERDRQEFQSRPWTVFADESTVAWLSVTDRRGHAVRPLADLRGRPGQADKTLVLVSAESLPAVPAEAIAQAACAVAWFGTDPRAAYCRGVALREQVDACFCADKRVAARAALLHPVVFRTPPGQALFDLAIAFANNRVFYENTVTREVRRRRLPEPFAAVRRQPNVLIQVDSFRQGGMEQVVLDLCSVLKEQGLCASLMVLGEMGLAAAQARQAGIEVVALPQEDRPARYRQWLEQRRIELVNAHVSAFGADIAGALRIPFVQTVHSCYVSMAPAIAAAHRRNDPLTRAYLCTSANTACYADLKLGLSPEKMLLAPNGIDPARLDVGDRAAVRADLRRTLGLATDDFVFLHVGSVYRDKAQALLVTALAEVVKHCPKAKLVLLGRSMDDAYVEEVRQEVRRTGLQAAVAWAGYHENVAPYYAMADGFVLPSFWEGWSLSLAEAIYVGLPVIATAVGSAPDLLPHVGGHLIRPAFDSLLDLDANNLGRYLLADHSRLIAGVAAAMREVCQAQQTAPVSDTLRQSLDRRSAYGLYARLFRWILQNGDVAAARAWTRPT